MSNYRNIKQQHIRTFKKLFNLISLILIFCLLIVIIYRSIGLIISFLPSLLEESFVNNEYTKIAISAIITVFLEKFMFSLFNAKNLAVKIKINLYTLLLQKFQLSNKTIINKIIEKIIYIVFYGDYKDVEAQINISNNIIKTLENTNEANKICFICGEAHSGKTVSVKRFINDILTDKSNSDLFKKYHKGIYYYDLEVFNKDIDLIINYLRNKIYTSKILIFDNLHKLDKNAINELVSAIFINTNNIDLIIILTRNIETLLNEDNLIKFETNNNKSILKSDDVIEKVNTQIAIDYFSKLIENFSTIKFDQFAQIHLYHVYKAYTKIMVVEAIQLFSDLIELNFNSLIYMSWAFICCSCCIKGYFNRIYYLKWIGNDNKLEANRLLNKFKKAELINNFADVNKSYYNLHEKVARFYVKYICRTDKGRYLCKDIFKFLYDKTEESIYAKYIYSITFMKEPLINFFNICQNVNYDVMLDDMNFMIEIFLNNKHKYAFELGILNDRIGHYALTEEKIKQIYSSSKDNRCLIYLLHGNHWAYFSKEYNNIYKQMAKSNNPYIKFATNYWIMHLYMHKGKWDIDNFVALSENIIDNIEFISKQAYDGFHFLRRYYFDCMRIYYLQGLCNAKKFNEILKKLDNIKSILNKNLEEFEYYNYKFFYAHLIHYDMLFKIHILKETVSEELSMLGLNSSRNLSKIAFDYYGKSRYMMNLKKDKTSDYVHLRMVELDPVAYLNSIYEKSSSDNCIKNLTEINTEDYEKIIQYFDEFGMNKGIFENIYEYAAFAETYKIKFTLTCYFEHTNINIDFFEKIKTYIANARKYHYKYNQEKPNVYGEFRLDFYQTITEYIENKDFDALKYKLISFKKKCQQNKFNREYLLINKILTDNNNSIEEAYLKDICKYYPIVLQ